ncbi:MAG: hypothetical protein ACRCUE_00135 [Bosea sp. (in: a-proteobacteria)]
MIFDRLAASITILWSNFVGLYRFLSPAALREKTLPSFPHAGMDAVKPAVTIKQPLLVGLVVGLLAVIRINSSIISKS